MAEYEDDTKNLAWRAYHEAWKRRVGAEIEHNVQRRTAKQKFEHWWKLNR